jgi:hypothetical protein
MTQTMLNDYLETLLTDSHIPTAVLNQELAALRRIADRFGLELIYPLPF